MERELENGKEKMEEEEEKEFNAESAEDAEGTEKRYGKQITARRWRGGPLSISQELSGRFVVVDFTAVADGDDEDDVKMAG